MEREQSINTWDQEYNKNSLSPEDLRKAEQAERMSIMAENAAREEERRKRMGYFEIPTIPNEIITQNFPFFNPDIVQRQLDYSSYLGPWTANRTIWICHNCGAWGYKYSIKELFRCYCCHSRNVTVCKSGELSLLIRSIQTPEMRPGVQMDLIFENRRRRLKEAKRAARR